MQQTRDQPLRPTAANAGRPAGTRLGGAPITWGACEVPGWGVMPDPERTLTEMAALGLHGTELGPPGFLATDPDALRAQLQRHGLRFVGAFTPAVLHEPDLSTSTAYLRQTIELLHDAGGDVLVLAAVQDPEWGAPRPLSDDEWRRLAEHAAAVQAMAADRGLVCALHSHVGTVIETAEQIERALAETDPSVGWCLDTGHLLIGGADPARFASEHGDRVTHVHLKDVDGALAADVREDRLSLLEATRRGLFVPLGQGSAPVADVLRGLDDHGYNGWLVLEQDTAIAADEPAANGGPIDDVAQSIAFITTAQMEETPR